MGASPLRDSGGAGNSGAGQETLGIPGASPPALAVSREGDSPTLYAARKRGPTKGRAPGRVAGSTRASPTGRPNPAADAARELTRKWGVPWGLALKAVTAAARVAGGVGEVRRVVEALPGSPPPEDPVSCLVAHVRYAWRRQTDREEAIVVLRRCGVPAELAPALAEFALSRGLGPAAVHRLAPEAAALPPRDVIEALKCVPRELHGWDAWRWVRSAVRSRQTEPAPVFRF